MNEKNFKDAPEPHLRGWFYVTCIRDSRYAVLAGPFWNHSDALAIVSRIREIYHEIDARSVFDSFGTARILDGPAGRLNRFL